MPRGFLKPRCRLHEVKLSTIRRVLRGSWPSTSAIYYPPSQCPLCSRNKQKIRCGDQRGQGGRPACLGRGLDGKRCGERVATSRRFPTGYLVVLAVLSEP